MNDTVVKTSKYLELKKKAEILDQLVKEIPDNIYVDDFCRVGTDLVNKYLKNKELWDGE